MADQKDNFLNKTLTLGEILQKQRISLSLSLQEISTICGVPAKFLAALENGQYKNLPAQVYVNSFIKKYATVLQLDKDILIKKYLQEESLLERMSSANNILVTRSSKIKFHHFLVVPKLIKNVLLILAICAFLGYLGQAVKKIMSPPSLVIWQPENNLVTNETALAVSGQTDKECQVQINGQNILLDNNGSFSEVLNLNNGVNIITITATNKHRQQQVLYRKIMVTAGMEQDKMGLR